MSNTTIAQDTKAFPAILKGTIVAENDRMDFWPNMYNGGIMAAMRLEGFIFDIANKMSVDYSGGSWEFVILDQEKKIYYIYPVSSKPMKACGILNHAEATIDSRIFGLITTMLGLAWLGDKTGDERLYEAYRNLHSYVFTALEDATEKYEDIADEEWSIEALQANNALLTVYNFLD